MLNFPSELSQYLLSFFKARERIRVSSVAKEWLNDVNDPLYWKQQLIQLWPAIFTDKRLANTPPDDYKKICVAIDSLAENFRYLLKQGYTLQGVLVVIALVNSQSQILLLKYFEHEIQASLKQNLSILFCMVPESLLSNFIKHFAVDIKAATQSGLTLYTCIINMHLPKKQWYLSLFNRDEILTLCNDQTLRQQPEFKWIQNYLYLLTCLNLTENALKYSHENNYAYFNCIFNFFTSPSKNLLLLIKEKISQSFNDLEKATFSAVKNVLDELTSDYPQLKPFCKTMEDQISVLYDQMYKNDVASISHSL